VTTLEGVGHASWRGRAPLVIAATIPLVILVALPWRAVALPAIPGFSAAWLTLLIGCDLLTVLLLLSQYRIGGSPRLVALSWAFLWSAGAAILISVAVPGLIQEHPTFASDANSMQWLWVSRHVVPPALVGLALAPWPTARERGFAAREGRALRSTLSWIVVGVATLLVALLVDNAPGALPSITHGSENRLDSGGIASVVLLNLAAVVLAVWGVLKRRSRNGLERWAVVASVAFLGDVWLTALYEDRFSIAYYLARLLGIAASAFVMLAVLRESARIQEQTAEVAHRLEDRNAELVEATRLRDHLTAVVSHDMRTPLAGLQGYLEMLRDDDLESALARRMLERSWMLTRRLTLLTEDLLAAATLKHGDLVVTPELVDLSQQLGECATCFPDLDLELDCPPGLAAYADPLRLQQILANLVRNAQKHGAEPVLIAASPVAEQPGAVKIRVSDAGPGVPATFVPRLFEPYSQGTSTATGGSGLGLSVVRDLVTAHRGTIRYDQPTNAFVLTLPPPPLHTNELGLGEATVTQLPGRSAPTPSLGEPAAQ
jgi:signal transduction histidine kinase